LASGHCRGRGFRVETAASSSAGEIFDLRFVKETARRSVRVASLVALCFATPAESACHGRDIFPILKTLSPLAFARMSAEVEATPFAEGRLFRLVSTAGKISFVFGSLHLSDPRATRISPALAQALETSDEVAIEMIETGEDVARLSKDDPARFRATLLAEKERRAERLLTREQLGRLEALTRNRRVAGLPMLDLKASALALLLDLPPCATEEPERPAHADARLAEAARRKGAAVLGLETFFEQIDSLDGLTRAEERDLLVATLRQAEQSADVVETTLERYSEGNIGWLLAWMRSAEPFPFAPGGQTPPAFLDRLITRRNVRMRERSLPLLERGGALIIVGAAHLPGAEGLLALLQQAGFAVERIE
jgi:uncharacterized protein YbaP (TraB family)